MASEGYDSADVLLAATNGTNKGWVLDSGYSFHMSSNREWFQDLTETEVGSVLLGNNKSWKIMGIGNVKLKMANGCQRTIRSVRYVPDLKRNLLSIGMLDADGFNIKVENGIMKVQKGSLTVMKGSRRDGLYILEGETIAGTSDATSAKEDKTRLWHLRLGHVSERGLAELNKQNLLGGDKVGDLRFCEECVLGKGCRVDHNLKCKNQG